MLLKAQGRSRRPTRLVSSGEKEQKGASKILLDAGIRCTQVLPVISLAIAPLTSLASHLQLVRLYCAKQEVQMSPQNGGQPLRTLFIRSVSPVSRYDHPFSCRDKRILRAKLEIALYSVVRKGQTDGVRVLQGPCVKRVSLHERQNYGARLVKYFSSQ